MQRILFCNDTYYTETPEQKTYVHGVFPYKLWKNRFLPHCDHLTIIGRNKEYTDQNAIKGLDQSSGPNTNHVLLPNINTPIKRLLLGKIQYKTVEALVDHSDGVIIRGPAELGMMAAKAARKLNKPYAVEMSGCAFDHTWNHGSLLGKLYAPIKYWRARHMVKHASHVIYVTKHFLQNRYPTNGKTASASNVEISAAPDTALKKRLQKIQDQTGPVHIGIIGNYGNKLKGLDIAIRSMIHLKYAGKDFKFSILGNGNQKEWEDLLKYTHIKDDVEFVGALPSGKPVLDWLDTLDLYIQPSRHEGLPRAVIEAMSRGLPCLASNAGGTEELLDSQCIHTAGNHKQLAKQLEKIWPGSKDGKGWQTFQAQKNFEIAKAYSKETLTPIRHAFWEDFTSNKS